MRWVWILGLSLVAGRAEAKARGILGELGEVTAAGDALVDQRVRYASHAHGILRYAHRLSPEDPEVLSLPGTDDDELGK